MTDDVFVLLSSVGHGFVRAFHGSMEARDAAVEQVKRLREINAIAHQFGKRPPAWTECTVSDFLFYWKSGKEWVGVKRVPVESWT